LQLDAVKLTVTQEDDCVVIKVLVSLMRCTLTIPVSPPSRNYGP
jgi:hypothetical protein